MRHFLALLLFLLPLAGLAQSLPPVNSVPAGCGTGKALVWSAGVWNCSVGVNKISLPGTGSAVKATLPANASILQVISINTVDKAVTGGVKFGTTSGASDIVSAVAVPGFSTLVIPDALMLKRFFSVLNPQTIFVDALVSWNGAKLDITILYLQL